MTSFEIVISILMLMNYLLILKIFASSATCPITKKKDFKKNMYPYTFFYPGVEASHNTVWYTKKGYEKRFDCKIVSQEIQKENWTTIQNKKTKKK